MSAFRHKFYGNEVIPSQILIPLDRELIALQLSRWKFLDNET